MKPSVKWAGAAALLVLGGLYLGWFWQRGTPVQVVRVTRQTIVQSVAATGRLNTPARIEIGAEVSGTVSEVRVREGDSVQAGEVLLRLSDAETRAALQQARAAWVEARGRARQQASVTAPVSGQAVVQAEAAFAAAQRDYQRTRELVAQGFFAQQKLDEAQRALDTARSALTSAQVQAQANQARGVEPALAAARVAQALAALGVAQARLARLVLRSPVNALVLSRQVEPGNTVQPGKVLLTLAAAGGLRIDAAIDERHLQWLRLGMPARAVADAYPEQAFDAQLTYIAPAVDPQRGSVEVRLAVPQPPPFLRPDMTVSVELVGASRANALVLTSGAVRDTERGKPWVLRFGADGRAERVQVTLGLRGVGAVEVQSGLKEGDEVIAPTEKALPGDRVRRVRQSADTGSFEVPSFMR